MIEVKNLVKEFDGFRVLDGLSLCIDNGSIYGLVGPNGSGKSTLIRHLTGVYKQNSGEILYDGAPVYENPSVKSKIAYIPDDLFYFGNGSVKNMLDFYKRIYDFDFERFEKLKTVFQNIKPEMKFKRMSKGMQKQAAFWLAICCRPEFLILDEPVDGLDPVMRRQIWSLLLQDVAERGTTVLVSSHNLRELEDVCDSVGIINKGKKLLEKSLSSLQGETKKIQLGFAKNCVPDFIEKKVTGEIENSAGRINIIHISNSGNIYQIYFRISA